MIPNFRCRLTSFLIQSLHPLIFRKCFVYLNADSIIFFYFCNRNPFGEQVKTKIGVFMVYYLITVYASMDARRLGKKLYERELTLPSTCEFDYSLMIKALRVLYGLKCVIDISNSTI